MNIDELKDDPFMTPAQIAVLFAVKTYTVRQWIRDEKFDATKIQKLNGRIKVRRSAVQQFAQDQFGSDETNEYA